MPDNLCLITLGSVIIHMKSVSFLRFTVNSCIAELDLFKFICTTLIFFSRDSVIYGWMQEAVVALETVVAFEAVVDAL